MTSFHPPTLLPRLCLREEDRAALTAFRTVLRRGLATATAVLPLEAAAYPVVKDLVEAAGAASEGAPPEVQPRSDGDGRPNRLSRPVAKFLNSRTKSENLARCGRS